MFGNRPPNLSLNQNSDQLYKVEMQLNTYSENFMQNYLSLVELYSFKRNHFREYRELRYLAMLLIFGGILSFNHILKVIELLIKDYNKYNMRSTFHVCLKQKC